MNDEPLWVHAPCDPALLEAVRKAGPGQIMAMKTTGWTKVSELPKRGRILAIQWHEPPDGVPIAGCWSHPVVYAFEETRNAWIARREGLHIPVWNVERFFAIPLPDELPAPPTL